MGWESVVRWYMYVDVIPRLPSILSIIKGCLRFIVFMMENQEDCLPKNNNPCA